MSLSPLSRSAFRLSRFKHHVSSSANPSPPPSLSLLISLLRALLSRTRYQLNLTAKFETTKVSVPRLIETFRMLKAERALKNHPDSTFSPSLARSLRFEVGPARTGTGTKRRKGGRAPSCCVVEGPDLLILRKRGVANEKRERFLSVSSP